MLLHVSDDERNRGGDSYLQSYMYCLCVRERERSRARARERERESLATEVACL